MALTDQKGINEDTYSGKGEVKWFGGVINIVNIAAMMFAGSVNRNTTSPTLMRLTRDGRLGTNSTAKKILKRKRKSIWKYGRTTTDRCCT